MMEDTTENFMWRCLVPTLRNNGVRFVIVPKSVVEELNRLADDNDNSTARRAQAARKLVKELVDEDSAEVVGEKDDGSFADNLFQTIFTRFRLKYRLVLITQDRSLAKEILSLNNSDAVDKIQGIDAFRIGDLGNPMRWTLDPSYPNGVKYHQSDSADGFLSTTHGFSGAKETLREQKSPPRSKARKPSLSVIPFETQQRVIQLDETPITIRLIPKEGDRVKDAKGFPLCLGLELGRGGEGITYETDSDLVCKVYHRDCLKRFTIDKIKLMTSREVRHPAICWPVSLAYNSRDEIIGYLMPKAQGKELQRSVFIKPLLQETFPDWTRLHLVKLTSTILDAIAYLHSLNVRMGDINARNILVKDESSVFFVDCDSYQVEGFPCPVGMPPFLAPELYGKELRSTLRTAEAEYFAIATLVFMLLHPGKSPYSFQGGEDPAKNVRTQHFPYPRDDQGAQGVPSGPWRFMFSHLPHHMKKAFHQVFSDKDRLTVADWQGCMRRYKNDLVKKYVSDDPFPNDFKRLTKEQVKQNVGEWRICIACGKGFGSFKDEHIMCQDCFNKRRSSGGHVYKGGSNSSGQRRYAPTPQRSSFGEIAKKLFDSLF